VIGARKVLAIIPARGGSKGLPGKHTLQVAGRPLLAFSIEAAQSAQGIDRTVLSSDDDVIIATARSLGCDVPFRRPRELATDEARTIDVVMHALDQLPGYDVVVLLQPTSPLRTSDDIDAAMACFASRGAPACVSVCPTEHSPYWMYRIGDNGSLLPFIDPPDGGLRRQDLSDPYVLNGAIYIADVAWLRVNQTFVTRDTVAHVMPVERSIDIDTLADFEAFKTALAEKSHAQVPRTA
jgi:CMP-N,N'-diacetyllegionaminic acid synthase